MEIWAPAHLGSKGIDGLSVPPDKGDTLLVEHLITVQPLKSEPAQEDGSSPSIRIQSLGVYLGGYIESTCHSVLNVS